MARAAMPEGQYIRPENILERDNELFVRFVPEGGGAGKDFPFRRLGLAPQLEAAVVLGFARATGPGGTRRTVESVMSLYAAARKFAGLLKALPVPPTQLAQLGPAHVAPFRVQHTRYTNSLLQMLRTIFRHVPDLPAPFREALFAPAGPAMNSSIVAAYSDFEFRQIQRAARAQVRTALARIRRTEAELAALRTSVETESHNPRSRAYLLEFAARTGEIPARQNEARATGEHKQHALAWTALRDLFPRFAEVTALAVLLECVTGLNLGTIVALTASHARADAQRGDEPPVLLTRATKPRRGRYAAEMDVALTQEGAAPGPDRDDFDSPAGVYRVALEMCARARAVIGSDRLLVGSSTTPSSHVAGAGRMRPLPRNALQQWRPVTPDGRELGAVDSRRLRRAFVERHQRPVAHTVRTLANQYLARDSTALPSYQAVVGSALVKEVKRIRAGSAVLTLTEDDVRAAQKNPADVAERLEVSVEHLQMLLTGRLDTVATACVDHTNSPYSPGGHPCTASFLLCLGCPNARSEPRHIPVQAALLLAIRDRQSELSSAAWEIRFADAADQLEELLRRQHADLEHREREVSDADRAVIEQLLDGKLELR